MTVLTIIGVIVAVILTYIAVLKFNEYTYAKYKYEFFAWWSFTLAAVSYISIYFGYEWYKEAVLKNGDILNGQLLMVFGFIALIIIIAKNISHSGIIIGIFGSAFQLILYAILAVGGFIIALCLLAFASQTKPVYSINSRN